MQPRGDRWIQRVNWQLLLRMGREPDWHNRAKLGRQCVNLQKRSMNKKPNPLVTRWSDGTIVQHLRCPQLGSSAPVFMSHAIPQHCKFATATMRMIAEETYGRLQRWWWRFKADKHKRCSATVNGAGMPVVCARTNGPTCLLPWRRCPSSFSTTADPR